MTGAVGCSERGWPLTPVPPILDSSASTQLKARGGQSLAAGRELLHGVSASAHGAGSV